MLAACHRRRTPVVPRGAGSGLTGARHGCGALLLVQSDLPARRQFPRSRLADAVRGVEEISAAYGVAIATLGHAGDGNLHPTMVTPRGDAEAREGEVQAFDAVLDPGPAAGRDVTASA